MNTALPFTPTASAAQRPWVTVSVVAATHAALLAVAAAYHSAPPAEPVVIPVQMVDLAPLPTTQPDAAPEPAPAPAPAAAPKNTPKPEPITPERKPTPQPTPKVEPKPTQSAKPEPQPSSNSANAAATSNTSSSNSTGKGSTPSEGKGESAHQGPALELPSSRASYLNNPRPPYPPQSRRAGDTGTVTLRVLVGADGSAKRVTLRRSSGFDDLDQSALDTVRRWRFVPGKRHGVPTDMEYDVPINFTLSNN